jgi:hypothetical protein
MSIASFQFISAGGFMIKLNTYSIYDLAVRVHPLTTFTHTEGMTLADIFWQLIEARNSLQWFSSGSSFFSPSLKRAAGALLRSIHDMGIPAKLPWEGEGGEALDLKQKLEPWNISALGQSAKDFETVLANELPGLDIYHVSSIGIYSTPALIENAELAILEGLSEKCRGVVTESTKRDFNQAGRCLAFELATAAGFHTMRSVEAVLRDYWILVKKPASGTKPPEMAQCINELRSSGEDPKLMDILDHIRDLHRNTLMHPEAFLQMTEALRLFDISKSAISAMAERMHAINTAPAALSLVARAALSGTTP